MTSQVDPQKVLVFYGRNERIRMDVFAFLRAIGLDPIEWTKAVEMTGKASPYVGEILDAALDNAQAIVVVMTPDDEAKLRDQYIREEDPEYENILTPQSRPNVLFEAGLALGRSPNQTILVEIGDLRPFSDIAGRHTIRLDNSPEKRLDLATRLKTAGCQVDTDGKTDWQTVGDFTIGPDEATTITIPPNREITLPGFQFLPSRGILERVRGGLEKELEDAETVWLAWSTGDVARGKQTMSADEIRKKVERLILIDYAGRYPEIHAPLFGTTPRTMRELIKMALDAMCPLLGDNRVRLLNGPMTDTLLVCNPHLKDEVNRESDTWIRIETSVPYKRNAERPSFVITKAAYPELYDAFFLHFEDLWGNHSRVLTEADLRA